MTTPPNGKPATATIVVLRVAVGILAIWSLVYIYGWFTLRTADPVHHEATKLMIGVVLGAPGLLAYASAIRVKRRRQT